MLHPDVDGHGPETVSTPPLLTASLPPRKSSAMSAFGPKQTRQNTQSMSLLGVKRTCSVALHMSAFDPKRTSAVAPHMSAFGGKADMTVCGSLLSRSPFGAKRTSLCATHMSASDPKQTLLFTSGKAFRQYDLVGGRKPCSKKSCSARLRSQSCSEWRCRLMHNRNLHRFSPRPLNARSCKEQTYPELISRSSTRQ